METIEPKERERIAQILRDNITFSGQVGDYVIHGAIDKIQEEFIEPLRKDISKLEAENKELKEEILNLWDYEC